MKLILHIKKPNQGIKKTHFLNNYLSFTHEKTQVGLC